MPSSVILNIGYNKATSVLTIKFISGKAYEYLNVPESIYQNLKSASSKGSYFNLHIKHSYVFRKLNASDTYRKMNRARR